MFVKWVTCCSIRCWSVLSTVHLASQGVDLTNSIDTPSTVRNAHCLAPLQARSTRSSGDGAQEPAYEQALLLVQMLLQFE